MELISRRYRVTFASTFVGIRRWIFNLNLNELIVWSENLRKDIFPANRIYIVFFFSYLIYSSLISSRVPTWPDGGLIIGSSISYYLFRGFVNLHALIISRIITCRRANVRRGGTGISVRQHDTKLMSVPERGIDRPGHFNFDCIDLHASRYNSACRKSPANGSCESIPRYSRRSNFVLASSQRELLL